MGLPRIDLRLKLAGAFITLAFASVLATGWTTIHYSYGALKRQKQQDELVIARNIAVQTAEVMGDIHYRMENLARDPGVVGGDPRRLQESLTLTAETSRLIDSILFVDLDGRVLAAAQDPSTPRITPAFPKEAFVAPMLASGAAKTAFPSVYVSRSGDTAVAVLAPVVRDGRRIGILAGALLPRIHSMGAIDAIRVGDSGYAYIVDGRGDTIVRPSSHARIGRFASGSTGRELRQAGGGVAEYVDELGASTLAAVAPIPGTDWAAFVVQPTPESYAFADRMRFLMSLVLLASLAAAAGLGIALAGRIARPISRLARSADLVAKGDFGVRVPVDRGDEVGELSAAFNAMTKTLAEQRRDVEAAHQEVLLGQKSLAQSEKMAAIGSLAAGLAHEINNPLTVIAGFGEFIAEKTSPGDALRGPAEEIVRETSRCRRLVGRLLHFSKPKTSGRTETDLNALLRDTLALVNVKTRWQRISVEERLAPGLPLLALDRDEIQQVFLNVLLNACQAMPSGGVLRVTTQAGAGRIEAVVTDDGGGISAEDMPKIFDAFFTTKPQGTGLGLALSYAMIERHGGTIRARSRPGEGAEFTVSLPIHDPAREDAA